MAKKNKKKALEELKQPDQFVTFWSRTGESAAKHAKAIIIALVVVIVGVAGADFIRDRQAASAGKEAKDFGRIVQIAQAPLLPLEGDAPEFGDDLPHFKTDAERKEAAIKEAAGFESKYGSSKLSNASVFLRASFSAALGRQDEALKLFEQLAASDLNPAFRAQVVEGKALTLEALGNREKAVAVFDTLAKDSGEGYFGDRALYGKARLLQEKGEDKAALQIYRGIVETFPTSALRDDVNDRIALLDVEPAADPKEPAAADGAPAAAQP